MRKMAMETESIKDTVLVGLEVERGDFSLTVNQGNMSTRFSLSRQFRMPSVKVCMVVNIGSLFS